jgi:Arc/MetJ-type ribon-helix-helix transcriptional regulator
MPEPLPLDLEQFVQDQLATGAYPSRDVLLADAIRRLRDIKSRLRRIRESAQRGMDEIDRGDGIQLADDKALAAFLEDIEAEVDGEIAGRKASE